MTNSLGIFRDIVFCISAFVIVLLQKQYFSRIRFLMQFLIFFGKHSMNIFLVHTFIFIYFCHDFIYSFRFGLLILGVLMLISMGLSYIIRGIQKVVKMDLLIEKAVRKVERIILNDNDVGM